MLCSVTASINSKFLDTIFDLVFDLFIFSVNKSISNINMHPDRKPKPIFK